MPLKKETEQHDNTVPPQNAVRALWGELNVSQGITSCQGSSSGAISSDFPPWTCPNEYLCSLQVKSFPNRFELIDSFRAFLHTASAAFQTFIFLLFLSVCYRKLHSALLPYVSLKTDIFAL